MSTPCIKKFETYGVWTAKDLRCGCVEVKGCCQGQSTGQNCCHWYFRIWQEPLHHMNYVWCLSLLGWINMVTWPIKKLLFLKTYSLKLLSWYFWWTMVPTTCFGAIIFLVADGLNKCIFGDQKWSPGGQKYRLWPGSNPDFWSVNDDQPPHISKPFVSLRLNKFRWRLL